MEVSWRDISVEELINRGWAKIKPMEIPEIVREHVIRTQDRMPKTQKEIDDYLDLINRASEYAKAFEIERLIGKRMMARLGFKTCAQIQKDGLKS